MTTSIANIPDHVPAELVMDCPAATRPTLNENVFETKLAPLHETTPPVYWCPNISPDGSGGWIVRRVDALTEEIGSGHVGTPGTHAHLVWRHLLVQITQITIT